MLIDSPRLCMMRYTRTYPELVEFAFSTYTQTDDYRLEPILMRTVRLLAAHTGPNPCKRFGVGWDVPGGDYVREGMRW